MLLKCICENSTADLIHGKGVRPHIKLQNPNPRLPDPGEYLCEYCSYVRSKALGLRTGKKEMVLRKLKGAKR